LKKYRQVQPFRLPHGPQKPVFRSLFHSDTSPPNGRKSPFGGAKFAPVFNAIGHAGPFRPGGVASCFRASRAGADRHAAIPAMKFAKYESLSKSACHLSNQTVMIINQCSFPSSPHRFWILEVNQFQGCFAPGRSKMRQPG
jgi:hypothetical protein